MNPACSGQDDAIMQSPADVCGQTIEHREIDDISVGAIAAGNGNARVEIVTMQIFAELAEGNEVGGVEVQIPRLDKRPETVGVRQIRLRMYGD